MFSRLLSFLLSWMKNRFAWVLIGLILLSVLIWLVGPIISIGLWMPLEPVIVRVVIICLVFGVFFAQRIIGYWRAGSLNQKFLGVLVDVRDARARSRSGRDDAEIEGLRKRFDEAMSILRKARFDDKSNSVLRLLSPKQYVYQLPWYVIIGAPGSGKTTVLANSGLEFPLASSLGRGSVKGVGGTRDCDWWFTDQAVLLDTAGRYTTHESNDESDRKEWQGFLGLIKKFRPRQPINGALVTVSVADLLATSEEARKQYALNVRSRLDELREVLGMSFPVYFLITKCDLMSGFAEFFDGLDKAGRAQVWGFTLPHDSAEKVVGLRDQFRKELDVLQEQLHVNLLDALQKTQDTTRRALCYAFPQQFAGLGELFLEFVNEVAVKSRFQASVEIRGAYFTSGMQEGAPFDRVLSQLDATFQSAARTRSRSGGTGVSYFIQDTLRRVVFPEAHLAGANQKQDQRLRWLRYAGYGASALALLCATIAWTVSYRHNTTYIAEVEAKSERLAKDTLALSTTEEGDPYTLLPVLVRADEVANAATFPYSDPSTAWTFGLYQGEKLHAAGDIVYRKLVRRRFVPALDSRIETLLRSMEVRDIEFAFETLRGYLMLRDPARFNGKEFKALMLADWDRNMTQGSGVTERGQLDRHLGVLGDIDERLVVAEPDLALVEDARSRLSKYSASQRIYSRLKRTLWSNQLPEFTIARVAGEQGASVFKRKSGNPLTSGVPSFYSHRAYHELFLPELEAAIRLVSQDDSWVLGVSEKSELDLRKDQTSGALALEVKRLYARDYVIAWEQFLDDIGVVKGDTLLDSVQLVKTLASPDSPLSLLIKAAARETTLSKVAATDSGSASLLDRVKGSVRATRDDLSQLVGPSLMPGQVQPRDKPEAIVDSRFEALRRLAGGGSGSSPIDGTLQILNEYYSMLAASDSAIRSGGKPPVSDLPTKLRAEAGRLPQPARQVVDDVVATGEIQVAQHVRQSKSAEMVGEVTRLCQQAIGGRYPFARKATRDVPLEDFARLFGPGGKFDDYFQRNLVEMVDVSMHPWTLKEGARGQMGAGVNIASFEQAKTIREVFFRSGSDIPRISLTLKPIEMDAAITSFVLDVDGQVIRYQHGPQIAQTITWPGPRGSQQVRVMLEPAIPGSTSGESKEGPWALHRLFDSASISPGPSPEKFLATLSIGNRRVTLEVTASSVQNPFRMREIASFSCPNAL